MDIVTRHPTPGKYEVEITGRISNRTLTEAVVKPNSLVEVSTPSLVAITSDDWRQFATRVEEAIEYVEYHAGRYQRSGITPTRVTAS